MSLFDFGQQSNVQFSLSALGGATNANANGSAIDTFGFSGVSAALIVGGKGTATDGMNVGNGLLLSFWEGDDTTIATATRLSADNLIKSEVATAVNTVAHYSVRTTKRYLFPEVHKQNASGIFSNANVTVAGFLGFPETAPTD
jgi:hypothetical protein